MKRVGIVLPDMPGYSETFFRSKINGLIKNGFQVILFIDNSKASNNVKINCKVVRQKKLPSSAPLRVLKMCLVLLSALTSMPGIALSYLKKQKQEGVGLKTRLENLFINYHILSVRRLDFLHFGFTTMGVRREHVAAALGAKCSSSFRGYDIMVYPNGKKDVYKKLWNKLDRVHSLSHALINTASQHYGFPSTIETQIITPAVDINLFSGKELNAKPMGVIKLITVSRLHWVKGLEYLIHAVSLVNQRGIASELHIIGDGEIKDRLVFATHQLGVNEQTVFHGKKAHEEVRELLNQAHIYVQYSNSEGFCNAVLEAQAMGMPCIVSDAGGLPENVIDGETGWVVPRRRPKALADKIEEVIGLEKETWNQVAEHARNRVARDFNLDKQEQEFVAFFS